MTDSVLPTTPTELPLRPQDEVDCRRCEVHCGKVVYPGACIERACDVEIDLDLLRAAENRRDGFGAVVARRPPLPMCHAEVSSCYEQRGDEAGCRNPEFFEMPVESATFRVFAQIDPAR